MKKMMFGMVAVAAAVLLVKSYIGASDPSAPAVSLTKEEQETAVKTYIGFVKAALSEDTPEECAEKAQKGEECKKIDLIAARALLEDAKLAFDKFDLISQQDKRNARELMQQKILLSYAPLIQGAVYQEDKQQAQKILADAELEIPKLELLTAKDKNNMLELLRDTVEKFF